MTETENGLDQDVGSEGEKKTGVANGRNDVKPDLKDAAKRNYEDSDDDDESPLCKCITENCSSPLPLLSKFWKVFDFNSFSEGTVPDICSVVGSFLEEL
jgi:hypothetical protein